MVERPCVYILGSARKSTLYFGVTGSIRRRAAMHRDNAAAGFAGKYGAHKLVWFEEAADMPAAIRLEKQLKQWNRSWMLRLIEEANPKWRDLWNDIAVPTDSAPRTNGAAGGGPRCG